MNRIFTFLSMLCIFAKYNNYFLSKRLSDIYQIGVLKYVASLYFLHNSIIYPLFKHEAFVLKCFWVHGKHKSSPVCPNLYCYCIYVTVNDVVLFKSV